MALSTGTKLEIASKRLDGKAYTNPGTPAASEEIPSLVQLSSNAVFYDQPPQNSIVPTSPSTYTLVSASLGGKPIAEYIEFDLTSDYANGSFPTTTATTTALLPTTDESNANATQHIFLAKLPTDYIASSNNPKKNTGFFTNGTFLTGSGFSLQLIPSSFGKNYTAKLYNGSTEIAANDPVDWNLDYSTGVVLVQDRTGTLQSAVPTKLKAYLYIGDYTSTTISNLSSSLAALSSSVITGTGNAGTASAGFLITSSNDGLLYTQSGSNAKNSLIFRDADITTAANQPIGRIAFESFDNDTTGSNQQVRAFIEAVSEDTTPDAFLAFGTAVSGSVVQERLRITSSGSVGIGTSAPNSKLTVSGSGAAGGIIVGHRVSNNTDSYAVHTFVDNEGPKIGFGSYLNNGTANLSASWGQIGAYNQALRFEAFTTGSHVLSGGILFSYSGSNRPDLKISASNGATLVGINTNTPTNTLEVNGGITAVNITASGDLAVNGGDITTTSGIGNIFSSQGINTINFGHTTATTINMGIAGGSVNVLGSITGSNLIVNGNTTLGDASADTASINAGRVNISNLPVGSSELAVLVTGSGGQVFTRQLAASAFSGSSGVSGTGTVDRLVLWSGSSGTTSVTNDDAELSFDRTNNILTVGTSTFGANISASGNITGSNLRIAGNSTIGGTLDVTGVTTLSSQLNVNSSNGIVTNQTTSPFPLLNTNVQTINFGGAATNINMGASNGTVTIAGNLTVNGDTTIINTSTISIEDKFIILGRSSGSQAPASEGGIIVEGAAGSGSAFVFNSGSAGGNGLSNRWGVALGVPTGSSDITPTDFMVTVSGSAANPIDTSAPTYGSSSFGFGNMHVNTSTGEIWIWS